ncbi:MAG: hypothetical protein Q4B94_01005 [Pseudomonadota bacterium]|nr:hypothetical protein [Pseudomonadota bacterium]
MSTSGNHGNQPRPLGTIVVIGRGFSISLGTDFGGSGMHSEPPSQHASIGDDFSSSDTDKNEIEIKVEFERPLTDDEKKALDDLAKSIAEISRLLSKLPADARIKLSDGKEITGQELKDIWSRTDFLLMKKERHTGTGQAVEKPITTEEIPVSASRLKP